MEILELTVEDAKTVGEVVELANAVRKVDSPWVHPETVTTFTGTMTHGWDGEPPRCFVGLEGQRTVASGELWISEWDNTHLAWAHVSVHPDDRRRGHGTAMFEHLEELARRSGRTSIGTMGWESPAVLGFAARHRLSQRSAAVNRRQHLDQLDRSELERMRRVAQAAAAAYETVRVEGRTPEDLLDAVAEMTAAINDAPTDDLDIEDEVFTRERVAQYEDAVLGRRQRLYRVLARHRDTGELAGHTVVAVELDRPSIGDQHDTSVVRAHRGHRLGILLKAEMLRWLADVEPQLATVDTWNAESNDHMIGVNETLGYRVLGRELQFQRAL